MEKMCDLNILVLQWYTDTMLGYQNGDTVKWYNGEMSHTE